MNCCYVNVSAEKLGLPWHDLCVIRRLTLPPPNIMARDDFNCSNLVKTIYQLLVDTS
jgi:hypothetical protein